MNELGKYIRKLRISRKIPLRVVALHVGKSVPYISDIELGRRLTERGNPELLIKLADFFQVPVTTLMEKGGYEVESSKEQYKVLIKTVRNKTKAYKLTEKVGVMKELLSELETATLGIPGVRTTVKNLIITLAEIESVFES